jgi:hypothetical protein
MISLMKKKTEEKPRQWHEVVTPSLSNKPGAPTCMPQYVHEVMSSMVINILDKISEYSALLHSLTFE